MTNIFQSFNSTHVASRHQTLTFAPEFLVRRVGVTQCTNVFVTKIRIERPCLPSFLSKDNFLGCSKYRSKSKTQQILGYHQHTPHVSQGLEAPTPQSQKDGSSTWIDESHVFLLTASTSFLQFFSVQTQQGLITTFVFFPVREDMSVVTSWCLSSFPTKLWSSKSFNNSPILPKIMHFLGNPTLPLRTNLSNLSPPFSHWNGLIAYKMV